MGNSAVTTALFMAAALATAPASPAAPPSAAGSAQAAQPTPSAPAAAAPIAAPAAVASTAPQDELDSATTVRPFEMPAAAEPSGPVAYAPADDSAVKTPVKVEEYHHSYEGPQDAEQASYEAGVKTAFEAEQALRGRLEGMWVVSADGGGPLLSLVISDPGRPDAPPGGAWRDLSRLHDPDASGLIDQVVEDGGSVIVQIRLKADTPPATLRLTPSADGRWRGLLLDGGKPKTVVMDRKAI